MSYQNINNIKTLIIGCGAAGLYYAYRDHVNNKNNKNIILDAYDWIGGRIKITTMRDKSFSTGAGVIRPVDDQLIKLCEELHLELTKPADAENYYNVFNVKTDEYMLFRDKMINTIKIYLKNTPNIKIYLLKSF